MQQRESQSFIPNHLDHYTSYINLDALLVEATNLQTIYSSAFLEQDVEANRRDSIQAGNDFKNDLEKIKKRIQKTENEVNEMLNSIKNATSEVAIVSYQKIFADESAKHEKNSHQWFGATVVVIFITILFSISFF